MESQQNRPTNALKYFHPGQCLHIKTYDLIPSSHPYSGGLAEASAARLSAYGLAPKPQSAWLPCPDLDRSPSSHIRAQPTAANGAVVNVPPLLFGTRVSTEARGPSALFIRPQSHQRTKRAEIHGPGRRLRCHSDRSRKQSPHHPPLISSTTRINRPQCQSRDLCTGAHAPQKKQKKNRGRLR